MEKIMRIVLQRVKEASVKINDELTAVIGKGILALTALNYGDDTNVFAKVEDKLTNLRIFEDENSKMNLSLRDIEGELLIVPNFTIYSDLRHGRRPSFVGGAKPDDAEKIYNEFICYLKSKYNNVKTGVFKADMAVSLINDGPITMIIDSDEIMNRKGNL